MKIAENAYVAMNYCLTLDSGEEVDRSEEGSPLGFIFGRGQIIPGLEKKLMGMVKGDSARVTVEPEDGYGVVQDEMRQEIPRSQFPPDADVQPGVFQAHGPNGPIVFEIISITDDMVLADFNHPLAGKRLHFDITVTEVREAHPEELVEATDSCGCGCSSSDSQQDCGCSSDKKEGCGSGCNC
ncbi:MAG: hypothetical protein A2511_11660 [Deltaproteobacteria bacterium RIFOXYD12_FULL_50_9]|nr:MAG: hypothetical protein A2511_11660 [Deltaproteobacteria bacterium RIFOXYD12_FULL_50_9]